MDKKSKYLRPKVIKLPVNIKDLVQTSSGCGCCGCPYVFVKNDDGYIKENNLLPYSENLGRKDKILTDYYVLQSEPKIEDNCVSLKIEELAREVSWFDKFSLMTVEHKDGYKIGISNSGEFLSYKEPVLPEYCKDSNNEDCLNLVSNTDWQNPDKFFCSKPGDVLQMSFGQVNAKNAKLVIVDPREEDDWIKLAAKCCHRSIHIYLDTGEWKEIDILQTREKFYPDIINLSSFLPYIEDELKIRLEFTAKHKVAYLGLDTSTSISRVKKTHKLKEAVHSVQGDVTDILKKSNRQLVQMKPDEEINLKFPDSKPKNSENRLTYVLVTKGYYIPVSKLLYDKVSNSLARI